MLLSLQRSAMLVLFCLTSVGVSADDRFQTTKQGSYYRDLKTGAGETVQMGHVVTIHFIGWLDDDGAKGKEVYNSHREGRPVSFVVGTDRLMPGWSDGVIGMKPGGKRMLRLPPALGYGSRRAPGAIPPDSGLMFLIDLLAVEQ